MVMDVSNNSLSGTLPGDWSALSNLRYFNLSSNQFSGGLPEVWRQSSANNSVIDEGMVNLQYL